jgi:hypothetical protein
MKTVINQKEYVSPQLERVQLDKEISLTLDSSLAPFGDPEAMMTSPLMASEPIGII